MNRKKNPYPHKNPLSRRTTPEAPPITPEKKKKAARGNQAASKKMANETGRGGIP